VPVVYNKASHLIEWLALESQMISLVHCDIIKESIGRVARIVVVVTRQRQRIGMTGRHAGRHLDPRIVVGAGPGQNSLRGAGSVILEGRCGPVILYRVRAMHLVPESQRAGSAGGSERLLDRTAPVGWRVRAGLTGVSAAVRRPADRGRAAHSPA